MRVTFAGFAAAPLREAFELSDAGEWQWARNSVVHRGRGNVAGKP